MAVEEVVRYQAGDGKLYETQEAAEMADRVYRVEVVLAPFLMQRFSLSRSSAKHVIEQLFENRDVVGKALFPELFPEPEPEPEPEPGEEDEVQG